MKNEDELSDEALGYASQDTLSYNSNINPEAYSERQLGLLHGFIDGYESCKKDVNDIDNEDVRNEFKMWQYNYQTSGSNPKADRIFDWFIDKLNKPISTNEA